MIALEQSPCCSIETCGPLLMLFTIEESWFFHYRIFIINRTDPTIMNVVRKYICIYIYGTNDDPTATWSHVRGCIYAENDEFMLKMMNLYWTWWVVAMRDGFIYAKSIHHVEISEKLLSGCSSIDFWWIKWCIKSMISTKNDGSYAKTTAQLISGTTLSCEQVWRFCPHQSSTRGDCPWIYSRLHFSCRSSCGCFDAFGGVWKRNHG